MKDEFYTIKEAATQLKLTPKTVRRLCREGRIPAVKIFGSHYRIDKLVIQAILTGKIKV